MSALDAAAYETNSDDDCSLILKYRGEGFSKVPVLYLLSIQVKINADSIRDHCQFMNRLFCSVVKLTHLLY
jgi:hypothetical protein